jgi:hypothetical protein
MPKGIKPMLAVLTNESFDDEDWIYEIKWDGYRSLAFVEDGEVELCQEIIILLQNAIHLLLMLYNN